jgi:hypothetical protein
MAMNPSEIEHRLSNLEKAVAALQKRADNPWPSIIGHFANDPIYDEIVRLGREYRDSQHPDRKKKKLPRKS